MQKKSIRSVSLAIIILLLSISILSACSKNKDAAVTSSPISTSSATETSASTVAPAPTVDAKYKFPYTGDPIELTITMSDFRTVDKTFDKLIDKKLEEMFGNVKIKYNYVAQGDLPAKAKLMLDTGDLSDIIIAPANAQDYANQYGATGELLDFSKYLDYMPVYKGLAAKYPLTFSKSGDSIYGINPVQTVDLYNWSMTVNNYYVKNFGIKVPTTADEMLESLRAAKKANPAMKAPYTVFPGGRALVYLNSIFLGLGYDDAGEQSCKVSKNWNTKDWYYPCFDAAFKDEVNFAHTLYSEGLMATDYDTQSWDKFIANLSGTGDGFFILGDWGLLGKTDVVKNETKFPGYFPTWAITPTSKYITKPVTFLNNPAGVPQNISILASSKTKNPELVAAFIDYLNSDEVALLKNWGIENKTFARDGEPDFFGSTLHYLPDMKYNAHPEGTVDMVKEYGLYGDVLRGQFSYAAGNRDGIIAQFQHDVDPTLMVEYSKILKYSLANPEQVYIAPQMPELTPDESDEITKIYTAMNTVIARNITNFIKGKRPMGEWDAFISELKKAGDPQKIIDIYNSKK
jgi:putative aldouronate transport system substrate-binding protein